MVGALQRALDPAIGHQPHERNRRVDRLRDPVRDERKHDRGKIQHRRKLAFPVAADRPVQERIRSLDRDDALLQQPVGDRGHQQDEAVQRGGCGCEMVFAHPRRREWKQRQPEQQVQVRPENGTGHLVRGVEHVVVVVPVDADVDEAQHVREEHRHERRQCVNVLAVRRMQLEHHDRDDHGNHPVAECLEAPLVHLETPGPAGRWRCGSLVAR